MIGFSEVKHDYRNDHDKLRNKYFSEDSKNIIVYRPVEKYKEVYEQSDDIIFSLQYVKWLEDLCLGISQVKELISNINYEDVTTEERHKLGYMFLKEDSKNSIIHKASEFLVEMVKESEELIYSEDYVYWLENLVLKNTTL